MLPGVDLHSNVYCRIRLIISFLTQLSVLVTSKCVCIIITFYTYSVALRTFLSSDVGTLMYLSVRKCLKFKDSSYIV